jgi:hypothetical protein
VTDGLLRGEDMTRGLVSIRREGTLLAGSTNKVANNQQRNSDNSINNSIKHVGMVLRHGITITMASRRHTRAAIAMRRKSGADDARRSHDEYFELLEIAMRRARSLPQVGCRLPLPYATAGRVRGSETDSSWR